MSWTFLRHPIFPVLCLIPLTQVVRDQYPVSHYPMYKQPTSDSLGYHFITDAKDKPLPIKWHTTITASQVGKKFNRHKTDSIAKEERKQGLTFDEVPAELAKSASTAAGLETLTFLREQSLKQKPDRHLKQGLRLHEVVLAFGNQGFTERDSVVAELPPAR